MIITFKIPRLLLKVIAIAFCLDYSNALAQTSTQLPDKYKFIDIDHNDTIKISELQTTIDKVFSNPSSDKSIKAMLNELAAVADKQNEIIRWWLLEENPNQLNEQGDSSYYYIYTITDSTKHPHLKVGGIKALVIKHKLNGDIVYLRDSVPVFIDKKRDRLIAEKDSALDAGGKIEDKRLNFYNVTGAVTGIWQNNTPLKVERNGDGALPQKSDEQYLSLITASVDFTFWKGSYINLSPEVAVGNGLGDGAGLAAYPNALYGFPQQKPYLVRAQIRQNFDFSANPKNKLEFIDVIAGRFILQEMFSVNPYSNDPRHDFLNFMHNMQGAWDAATTAYGYTYGVATNFTFKKSLFNAAVVTVNEEAGGPTINTDYKNAYSLNAQYVRSFNLKGRNGHIRFFGFYNRALTGAYNNYGFDSTGLATFEGLRTYKPKVGGYVDLDYNLIKEVGYFARVSWNDGKTESWGYTQADFSANSGFTFKPTFFRSNNDLFGISASYNTISKGQQNYLKDGGGNFMIANNGLEQYAPEIVIETFYSFNLVKNLFISPDYQFIMNPGYEKARGNTHVYGIRVNVDFF